MVVYNKSNKIIYITQGEVLSIVLPDSGIDLSILGLEQAADTNKKETSAIEQKLEKM